MTEQRSRRPLDEGQDPDRSARHRQAIASVDGSAGAHAPSGGGTVEALDGQLLSTLAARAPAETDARDDAMVATLVAAVREDDEVARGAALAGLIDGGVTVDALIDRYIPEAARRMGAAWCNDGMGFADVTIGTARLQGLLRDLARRTRPAGGGDPMAPQVLMVVRENNYHTLGAMVATQQMRRAGVDVHVSIGQSDGEILALVAERDFDMVMLSCAGSDRLEKLAKLVDNVRGRTPRPIPVVVGGSAMLEDPEMLARTGADFATADPEEALTRCGLKITRQGARHLSPSG